jgi:2'-5' RNA ligase
VTPTETGVIVPVPALEPVVGEYRAALDHSAVWGVLPHVTVLYPFAGPAELTDETRRKLKDAAAVVEAFTCVFDRVEWFGDDVVWLTPTPDLPFRRLTDAVWRAFPDHPPYSGGFPDPVPHLTVGSTRLAGLDELRKAAKAVVSQLPVRADIDRVWLVQGTDAPGSWGVVDEIILPAPAAGPGRPM